MISFHIPHSLSISSIEKKIEKATKFLKEGEKKRGSENNHLIGISLTTRAFERVKISILETIPLKFREIKMSPTSETCSRDQDLTECKFPFFLSFPDSKRGDASGQDAAKDAIADKDYKKKKASLRIFYHFYWKRCDQRTCHELEEKSP